MTKNSGRKFLVFFLFLGLGSELKAEGSYIGGIRYHRHPSHTRIVIDLKESISPSLTRASPTLIVVDFPHSTIDPKGCLTEIKDGLVRKVWGMQYGTTAKLLIRLEREDLEFEAFTLKEPHRAVIDLKVPKLETSPLRKFKVRTLVIDPGHGGRDPGAIGRSGLKEKVVVLDVAIRLKRILEREGFKVILTRSDDRFISLWRRAYLANESKANLFISLHCNAAFSSKANGFETFYFSEAVDERAMAVAVLENSVLEMEVPWREEGKDTFHRWDGFLRDESLELAKLVQENMKKFLKSEDRGVKSAPFYVLRKTQVPSILVEIGFITNPREEAQLASSRYRERIARILSYTVISYKRRREGG